MQIFLTGHFGYVGNILAQKLVEEAYDVVGCDIGYYSQDFVNTIPLKIKSLRKDIRELTKEDLKGCSAVVHLAALSNDPLGAINPSLTYDINYLATIRLAKLAKEVGVERFIYSSSCSTYGATNDIVNEESSLSPITAYAKSKVDSEQEILKLKDGIKEIYEVIKKKGFTEKDFRDRKFYRVAYIKWLMEQRILVDNLSFKNSVK